MSYSMEWLIEQFDQGTPLKFLFFWGHRPSRDGHPSKSCFSQWWEKEFVVDGTVYRTAEHWMMAEKARLFADDEVLQQILMAKTPGEAKKLGRMVRNFNPQIWDDNKFAIVKQGNLYKFSQDEDLKAFLLSTGFRVLVEASPYDAIWGIGMSEKGQGVENPHNWRGENLLGFALMEVRDQLMKEL